MSTDPCLIAFVEKLFSDMGVSPLDAAAAELFLFLADSRYQDAKPDESLLTQGFNKFAECSYSQLEEKSSLLFSLIESLTIIAVVVSIIAVVLFCLFTFYWIEPLQAILTALLYIAIITFIYFYYKKRVKKLNCEFNNKIASCAGPLSVAFNEYKEAQVKAIEKAIC